MASLETKIRQSGGSTKDSVAWLYSLAPKLRSSKVPPEAFNPRASNNVFIGGMFVYSYDPKWKEKLPIYDTLPVVIPIQMYSDGWLGMNLHYLPPMLRMSLLDKLMDYKKRAHTPRAYMQVSYDLLKGVVRQPLFEPTIHRYLASHVTSRLLRIDDQYWDKVATLPIGKFKKGSASQTWRRGR